MNAVTQQASQELMIVRAVASVDLPQNLDNLGRVGALVKRMGEEGRTLRRKANELEKARQEKRDGNLIGNLFKGRQEAMEDAQMDLNTAIGNLTASTSELLVINTALSKVLHIQQEALHDQQEQLESQAIEIREQNVQILQQQEEQARQQEQIILVSEGILEAKGLTQEQALKLVGCVERVTIAEQALKLEVQRLKMDVEERLATSSVHTATQMSVLQDSLTLAHDQLLASVASLHETVLVPLQADQSALRDDVTVLRQHGDALAAALVVEAGARQHLAQQHAEALAEQSERQAQALVAAIAGSDRRWESALAQQQTDSRAAQGKLRLAVGVTAVALVGLLAWQLLG
ncbi:hypothetical protein [Xanthomonas euroxanthea]|uniref:Uncharacterized protein n=2 Tax=Xanthomonas euroxanthea TaxID=2259622 RepID=A0AA46HAM4_9XANT|nr:hypothetical protein [Xanthomonas euroxanthea]CAE1136370.1 hypothetical protein XTG_002204 [Xanthomonas euroxanthea]SUZ28394.1 hypothetical protein CPBF424_22100 [Xanthomonas euroxanthea]